MVRCQGEVHVSEDNNSVYHFVAVMSSRIGSLSYNSKYITLIYYHAAFANIMTNVAMFSPCNICACDNVWRARGIIPGN